MIGWFNDGADRVSADGAQLLLPVWTLKKETNKVKAVQSHCVPVCSANFPAQSEKGQFPGSPV